MNIRPLNDHVIITRVQADTVTRGGLVIPTTAQEKTSEGIVKAIGKGAILPNGSVRPLDIKEGDKILFDKYTGHDVKINGEEFVVLREANVICILDN